MRDIGAYLQSNQEKLRLRFAHDLTNLHTNINTDGLTQESPMLQLLEKNLNSVFGLISLFKAEDVAYARFRSSDS